MIVYHGSTVSVKLPQIMKSDRMLDFGDGFYTTSHKEQVDPWSEIVAVKHKTSTYTTMRGA